MSQLTTVRSKYRTYRFGDTQFDNFEARVDASVLAAMKQNPHFGPGREMWIDHGGPGVVPLRLTTDPDDSGSDDQDDDQADDQGGDKGDAASHSQAKTPSDPPQDPHEALTDTQVLALLQQGIDRGVVKSTGKNKGLKIMLGSELLGASPAAAVVKLMSTQPLLDELRRGVEQANHK